jgi:hypothetical protein
MATRFYLHNDAAPYTPATIRGAWDASGSAVTKRLDASRRPTTVFTSVVASETSTNTEYDVLLYRGVSGPLKAGTIGTGTVNLCVGVDTSAAAADMHWHVHIYVTQGDSDTPRGTLLANYREAAGTNEWPSTDQGWALNAAQSLSSLAVSDGDRLVVELGYAARNASATSYAGEIHYGSGTAGDLTVASTQYASYNGWVEFSETIPGTADNRVTQGPIETAIVDSATSSARVSQSAVEVVMTDVANPARITQLVVELLTPGVVPSRVTQMVAELLTLTVIESRATQLVAEILNAQVTESRLSQLVVELLGKTSTYCGPPSLSPAALCGKSDVLAWLEWTVPMMEN